MSNDYYNDNDPEADQVIVQGENDPPLVWQFLANDIPDDVTPAPGDIFLLAGSTLFLTVSRGRQVLVAVNTDVHPELTIDPIEGKVFWTPPLETTRELPLGRVALYEIERRIASSQSRLIAGFLVVREGRNSD
jgi:hypothetical protein